jgi:hypothetical protein
VLCWIEDLLGRPLDPAPGDTPPAGIPRPARLHASSAAARVNVEIPWALLLACRPAADALEAAAPPHRWDAVPVRVALDHIPLDDAEWATLREPGAALLLRDALHDEGPWPCRLLADRTSPGTSWAARWDPARDRLAWDAAPIAPPHPVDAPTPGTVEVSLPHAAALTPPQLLGWHAAPQCACAPDGVVQLARLTSTGVERLFGRLVPLGLRVPAGTGDLAAGRGLQAGWAVRIDAGAESSAA